MKTHSELDELFGQSLGAVDGTMGTEYSGRAAAPESAHCLTLDQWAVHRGEQLAAAAWNDVGHDATVLADCHESLFSTCPKLEANPADKRRAQWFKALIGTPEYHALHSSTCLDPALSALGSKGLADQWATYAASLPEEAADGQPATQETESVADELGRLRSVGQALSDAQEAVHQGQDVASGLGMGGGDGQPLDETELADVFRRVRNDSMLREIMEFAGRARCFARAAQRTKTRHGCDDTVGVVRDGDIGRLLPSELMALDVPELELLTLARIADRQALCREYRGIEPTGQGPIVVVVDESGSMESRSKIQQAKGLALALGWVASHQRRWIAFVGFSHGSEGTRLVLPPTAWNQAALIDWLTHFYDGGTSLDVPCVELPQTYWPEFIAQGMPRGKTDVILITDAIVRCKPAMAQSFKLWKQTEQVTCYGLVVGQGEPGDIAKIAERVWCVRDLTTDQSGVGEVLSI